MPRGIWQRVGLKPGDTGLKAVFRHSRRNALKHRRVFELSIEDVKEITSRDCYYCGDPPSQVSKASHEKSKNGFSVYVYTGMDRVKNEEGYTKENVVTCCIKCNRMKHKLGQNEFFEHVRKIARRFPG